MSWLQKLYETYENCQSMIAKAGSDDEVPLLPICHTTQKAHIEIVVDENGAFKRASVIPRNESRTIIPSTESSAGRAGKKPDNHPLCDKLQYVAGDFIEYGGEVTSGYAGNPCEPFQNYYGTLQKWCQSKFSHPKAIAVFKYIEKGTLITDLVNSGILHVGNDSKLLRTWDGNTGDPIPEIFKLLPGKESWQADAFVRWKVEIPDDPHNTLWTDSTVFHRWIEYYSSTKDSRELCYVTGDNLPIAEQHPAKIRNDGDKAKLISSNDTSGFTFRGRFITAGQACGVGFEVTQKAHNALRWLISRQGYRRGDQTIVAWSTVGKSVPSPLADPFELLGISDLTGDSAGAISTAQELARKLKRKIAGYHAELGSINDVVVMGVDSATPGRMAISFYRELTGSEFLKRVENWHSSCCWIHNYPKEIIDSGSGQKKRLQCRFVGAPAPGDISEAAYGRRVDDKLRKSTVERILPCIIDGHNVPRDLVEAVVRRAANRAGLEEWEWNKTLTIACALYRKYCEKEEFDMSLDESRATRDYLYGRLLALADRLEQWALKEGGEKRQTNAARLMQRFADYPYSTWRTIELSLGSYKARLGKKAWKLEGKISEVMALFHPDDFISDRKLSGEFLLGYHCQQQALWNKEQATQDKEEIQ